MVKNVFSAVNSGTEPIPLSNLIAIAIRNALGIQQRRFALGLAQKLTQVKRVKIIIPFVLGRILATVVLLVARCSTQKRILAFKIRSVFGAQFMKSAWIMFP